MIKCFPHSQEDVRAIQSSVQRYMAVPQPIFHNINVLLQPANSQRRDIFRLFFKALAEQKVDLELYKPHLRGEVPVYYKQDLEQAIASSVNTVAMETLTTSAEEMVPGK